MAETFDVLVAGGGAKLLLRSARGLTPIEAGLIFLQGIKHIAHTLVPRRKWIRPPKLCDAFEKALGAC
jgi:hypothetical protein